MPVTNIRVLVPRVRRAVEGAGAQAELSDDALKDLVADALSSITLYTGTVFGKTIDVLSRDEATGAPSEYTTSGELTLQEGVVVASQAALDYFFFRFAGLKVSETIADEAGSWDYSLSPNLLIQQFKYLQSERDRALEALEYQSGALDSYVSFIAVRDATTAALVEPWVDGIGYGVVWSPGIVVEPDYRFGGLG